MKKDTLTSFDLRYNQSGCDESIILDINPVNRGRIKHNSNWVWLNPSILMESLKRHDYFQAYKVKKKELADKKRAKRKKKSATDKAARKKVGKSKPETNKAEREKKTEKNSEQTPPH